MTPTETSVEKTSNVRIRGYWIVYVMSLHYGGREEGGWWYDAGDMIACIPATRDGIAHDLVDCNTGLILNTYTVFNDEIPDDVQKLKQRLIDEGYGQFDSEYRSSRPRHDSLYLCWDNEIHRHFPKQVPRYE